MVLISFLSLLWLNLNDGIFFQSVETEADLLGIIIFKTKQKNVIDIECQQMTEKLIGIPFGTKISCSTYYINSDSYKIVYKYRQQTKIF